MNNFIKPEIKLLDPETVSKVVQYALDLLSKVGFLVDNHNALEILSEAGAKVDFAQKAAFISEDLALNCIQSAPSEVNFYDREENLAAVAGGDQVNFIPGSAALQILDVESGKFRLPVSSDLINFYRLVESLNNYKFQSTALISSEVPEQVADAYRLFLLLQYSRKPIVTGTFSAASFLPMAEMLNLIQGGDQNLKSKPRAVFDACPSPPLMWSEITSQNLIDCARSGIPAEIVAMPLTGATAPATLIGTVLMHTAEALSGIILHQCAKPGAPIIYGGSPAIFDMRQGTTPMGAIETMMIDSAYTQIGKYLNLPTHSYLGLSDAKKVDAQAGLESASGLMMAALSRVNMVSGPGMLNFESAASPVKLVLDHEICGMMLRLIEGINPSEEALGFELIQKMKHKGEYLSELHTLEWFSKEQFMPDSIIDRANFGRWEETGAKNLEQRAKAKIEAILETEEKIILEPEVQKELLKIMSSYAKQFGLDQLPNCQRC